MLRRAGPVRSQVLLTYPYIYDIYSNDSRTLLSYCPRGHGRNPMEIVISNSSDKPIYEQIASQIRDQVLSGELREGVPSH